jgi:hypothetical protein
MDKKKALELYVKSMKDYGSTDSGLLLPKSKDIRNSAFAARDLAEEGLADQILKNTGVPIPGKGSSRSQIENFLQDISKEHYPELGDIDLKIDEDMPDNYGTFDPKTKQIQLDKEMVRKDPRKAVAGLMHENAHKYDDIILGHKGGGEIDDAAFQKVRSQLKGKTDPTDIYETVARSTAHHAEIPKLREGGSFGLGALKSMLQSGRFKSLAPILTKGAVAGAGGIATLAAEAADTENMGDAAEQEAFQRESDEANRRSKAIQKVPEMKAVYDNIDNPDLKRATLNRIRGFSGK